MPSLCSLSYLICLLIIFLCSAYQPLSKLVNCLSLPYTFTNILYVFTYEKRHYFSLSRYQVKLCATADNCLLTVWPYLALPCSQQHIVLKTGMINTHTKNHVHMWARNATSAKI